MNYQKFWQIIDTTRAQAQSDPQKQINFLRDELSKLHVKEVRGYYGIWLEMFEKANKWDLWAAAYLLGGGCSDEGFSDFRAWLISKGQVAFENALKDPNTLATVINPKVDGCGQVEGFIDIPYNIIEELGGSYSDVQEQNTVEQEPHGEAFDPDDMEDLRSRFPALDKLARDLEEAEEA